AQHQKVLVPFEQVQHHRGQCALVHTGRYGPGLRLLGGQGADRERVWQYAHLGCPLALPGPVDGADGVLHDGAELVVGRLPVESGQCGLCEQLPEGECAAGRALLDGLGELAGDGGLGGVVQVQFDLLPEVGLHGDAYVVPTQHARHDVDAVPAAALQQVGDDALDLLEVLADGPEPVDAQDHVGAGELGDLTARVHSAQLRDRVDGAVPKHFLAMFEHAADLLGGAADALGVGTHGHTTDVGQAAEGLQAAADQVQAVDGDLVGCVGQGQGGHEGAQQGGLAALRATDEGHVST